MITSQGGQDALPNRHAHTPTQQRNLENPPTETDQPTSPPQPQPPRPSKQTPAEDLLDKPWPPLTRISELRTTLTPTKHHNYLPSLTPRLNSTTTRRNERTSQRHHHHTGEYLWPRSIRTERPQNWLHSPNPRDPLATTLTQAQRRATLASSRDRQHEPHEFRKPKRTT